MTTSIDLSDPRVREMLSPSHGGDAVPPVVQIAGDAPDPTGVSGLRGVQATHHLNAGKQEVVVVYGDLFMTVDVYRVPGEPVRVHLICPRCHKTSQATGDRKAIAFDPSAPNPQRAHILASRQPEIAAIAATGRLSIEAFECAWEIGDTQHVQGGLHTGVTLCRQRLVIDDNRARDA